MSIICSVYLWPLLLGRGDTAVSIFLQQITCQRLYEMNDMKVNRTITLGATFILGFAAGWLAEGKHWDVFLTSYIPSLATLVAAFYGAKYAFQFQKDKETEDSKNRNVVNGNNSIFALMRMANKLAIFQRQIINPIRNSPARFLEMPSTITQEKDDIKLNIEKLYFLLETDDRNLLGEIMVEEDRYRSAIDAINLRSQLHLHEVQPLLERAGFVAGGQYSFAQIEGMLGQRLYATISQATDDVIRHVDATVVSIKSVSDKLTASLKKQYPDEKIISFAIPDLSEPAS